MPWLTPNDLARALTRSLLLLAVPLIATLRSGLSLARILTVLSFAAAIAAACWAEAWARAEPSRRLRLGERAFLVAYLGAWLPVIEVLYLRNAPGAQGPSGLAHLFQPTPATWLALVLTAVALVPVASALAAGSLIHHHHPFERGEHESPWRPLLWFSLRQGLLCAALAAGLTRLPEVSLSLGGALALGGLTALGVPFLGVSLAAIYLCCDAVAAAWSPPAGDPADSGASSDSANHGDSGAAPPEGAADQAKSSGSTETLTGQ